MSDLSRLDQRMVEESGKWTPTLFNTTNVGASTAYECNWMRFGNVVWCWGIVDVNPTAAGDAATILGMSLPIPPDFSSGLELAGTAAAGSVIQRAGTFLADGANNRARLLFTSQRSTNTTFAFHFSYRIP